MAINCSLSRIFVGCISVFIEVLWSWSIFVIVLKELFYDWLFIYEQCSYECIVLYFSIMLRNQFSHTFFVKSTYNTVFFQVYDWCSPGSLVVSGLILLTSVSLLVLLNCVFVDVLMLIWSILMLKCISKIIVGNGFNHLMGWCHIYVCCLWGFKDFFNCVGECSGELVDLW